MMTRLLDWLLDLVADLIHAVAFKKEDPWATVRLDLDESDLP